MVDMKPLTVSEGLINSSITDGSETFVAESRKGKKKELLATDRTYKKESMRESNMAEEPEMTDSDQVLSGAVEVQEIKVDTALSPPFMRMTSGAT